MVSFENSNRRVWYVGRALLSPVWLLPCYSTVCCIDRLPVPSRVSSGFSKVRPEDTQGRIIDRHSTIMQGQPPSLPSFSLRAPVGVVIAHPDDESMFFAPALSSLARRKNRVMILCLSSGMFHDKIDTVFTWKGHKPGVYPCRDGTHLHFRGV